MKKVAFLFLGLLWSSIAVGAVSMRVCEADGNTPFCSDVPIMVGTKLTIYVDSNSAKDWVGGLDVNKSIADPNPPIGKLFGRGWDLNALDYVDSRLSAAGIRAKCVDWENQDQQSFELTAVDANMATGTWFVIDYNAMSVGDCTIKLVEFQGNQIVVVASETIQQVTTRDFNGDGYVDFADYAKLASYWRHTDCGVLNNCGGTDLHLDGKIDLVDVMYFAQYWLGQRPEVGKFLDGASMNGNEENLAKMFSGESMIGFDTQQQQTMTGGEQSFLPYVYMVADNNNPGPNDEVTVWVHSDIPLFCMGMLINVTGDAEITTAMDTADCNQFGWDPSWPSDPYIDPNGWIYVSGVQWASDVSGVVGYLKFRYHGGEVGVSFDTEYSGAYDANGTPVPFSPETLLIGRGLNEP